MFQVVISTVPHSTWYEVVTSALLYGKYKFHVSNRVMLPLLVCFKVT